MPFDSEILAQDPVIVGPMAGGGQPAAAPTADFSALIIFGVVSLLATVFVTSTLIGAVVGVVVASSAAAT